MRFMQRVQNICGSNLISKIAVVATMVHNHSNDSFVHSCSAKVKQMQNNTEADSCAVGSIFGTNQKAEAGQLLQLNDVTHDVLNVTCRGLMQNYEAIM